MSEPFLSEIKIMSFQNAPIGWALCNGQFLPINQNQALFALLGVTYGGNGQTTFALPDLRGRVPISMGSGFNLGTTGGQQTHTLTMNEMTQHLHFLMGTTTAGTLATASNNYLAAANNLYAAPGALTTMNAGSVTNVGGSQAHQNMQPYLTLSFCIALQGIFPSRN